MISGIFMLVLSTLFGWVGGLLPASDPTSTAGTVAQKIGGVLGWTASFGAWVPFGTVGQVLLVVAAVLGVALAIRLIRMGVSFFTGGGGSAG